MFTEILKEKRLQDIIEIFDRDFEVGSIESNVESEIKLIIKEIYSKNNEFVDEIVRDRTLLRLKKIKKLRNRAQDGHIQLVEFKKWLWNLKEEIDRNRFTNIDIDQFIDSKDPKDFKNPILPIINYFEGYVLKLKDRETSIISVQASLKALIVAILAIGISIASIILVNVL